ncbi:MAG: DUF6298 domain-containing protein [Pirellulaceae bacterium]|nr:DUF6298 domain-containing protein [Pirellulaceae bacterium]
MLNIVAKNFVLTGSASVIFASLGWLVPVAHAQDRSKNFVYQTQAGTLAYPTDGRGNRVPDYSHCGYQGGNSKIPDVQAIVLVEADNNDATERIQAAIDFVSELPVKADGLRGAVLMGSGDFHVSGQLNIRRSGVVLRGSKQTTIFATGHDRRALIRISGLGTPQLGDEISIADEYVPVGAKRLRLKSDPASLGVAVGSEIVVLHPSTIDWIASIGMNRFPTDDKGSWLDWKPRTLDVQWERTVTRIDGDEVHFDVPLTCSIDSKLTSGVVRSFIWPQRINHVGVESLQLVSVSNSLNPKNEEHAWDAISIEKACDVWVRDVSTRGFAGSSVSILETAKQVTVARCSSAEPISEHAALRRRTYYTCGQQTLFFSCKADSGRNDFAVGYLAAGPNAFVHCQATNAQSFSGPVESWATGVLYDNITLDGGGLMLTNREIDGQGVGWTTANSMLWQCSAPIIACRNPPGHSNWAVGCWAGFIGDGHWKSMNEFVDPDSLFEAQHQERLGASQSTSILATTAVDAKFDSIAPQSQSQFAGWLASKQSLTQSLKQSSESVAPPTGQSAALSIRGGWLGIDNQLVAGHRGGTMWWRGSMLPARTSEFGVGVTRFVPSRVGRGFTDDLAELTEDMVKNNQAVLEHHWGLWYDRRRDDHEMIRRIDAEVWGPFYEQPWARSGQGVAWDGLSKYDLEKFNSWYFMRLNQFAAECESHGRILLQQMYFQHNILEAGAHWADFPWRSANCLQQVGFQEPPPYAGKKRIFQADEFYDVSHPVRRALHAAYIQQCLNNMLERPNVIFSLGEEFTGPASFVRFWLETIAEWKQDHPNAAPLVCLSCTKDVQDEILADARLCALVQVIDLKYWWYTADGKLYAPEGGKNLAPRQQLREWKGNKSRSDMQTARQIHELRVRYPDKAVITNVPTKNPWATLAAGGSLPTRMPEAAQKILRRLPEMVPLRSLATDSIHQAFGLERTGECYLVFGQVLGAVFGEGETQWTLPLAAYSKEFRGQWIDPESGSVVREVRVDKGENFEASPPGSGAYLMWLESVP